MKVPFVDLKQQYLSIKDEIDSAIEGIIAESAFIGGKAVRQFESAFAEKIGIKHCISCANGTDSLYIIMKMLGIGPGDEVITAANSWISSAETITQTGARVVFCDVHPHYYSMDENTLEKLITPRTRAIIPVHLHGQMCEMDTLLEICKKHNLYLIEDCAQSHFSSYKGRLAGTMGIAGSFSFYPGKNLGAYGDAGCIVTNDDALAEKCRMFANHGALIKHQHQIEGINSRMDGLQAAILNVKLKYIDIWTYNRRRNAQLFVQFLKNIQEIILPIERPETMHSYHLFVIQTDQRDSLKEFLALNGIETAIHYPKSLPNLKCYQYTRDNNEFPVSSHLEKKILSLPMHADLTNEQITFVSNTIRNYFS